ncbi:hypothetical protein F4779DRAFT_622702 [Xylariaceae sp. FL0662B]|nr:hypothetical protein F4779DRAFT_622702 [Xylariaceae sp. FL0662B]
MGLLSEFIFAIFVASPSSHRVAAQQLQGYRISFEQFSLQPKCLDTLNTNITSCNRLLAERNTELFGATALYSPEETSIVCVDQCRRDLELLRGWVLSHCSSDHLEAEGASYPPSLFVDHYLYNYDVACYKDVQSGSLCDIEQAEAQTKNQTVNPCSDCVLGVLKTQLQSPLGYDPDVAADFSSLTISCQATGYAYSTPAPYALNATSSPGTPTATSNASVPACSNLYTVADGDTCQGIAAAKNVSTFGIISANNLDIFCSSLIPGSRICLPLSCQTYNIMPGDTCRGIVSRSGVTMPQFLAWNPIFDARCTNLDKWWGWAICVSPPVGAMPTQTPIAAAPLPSNAMAGSTRDCAEWHTVEEGDTCEKIIPLGSSLTFQQFLIINTDVNANCTNLWLGYAYCIQPVTPVELPATTTFARPPPSPTSTIVVPSETQLPLAPGSQVNCTSYRNYLDVSVLFADDPNGPQVVFDPSLSSTPNSCLYVAAVSGVTLSDFIALNPSLTRANCSLSAGYSYCIGQGNRTDSKM